MLNSPFAQSFYYQKTPSAYPAAAPQQSIRRSGSSDVFSYINQAAKNSNSFKSANNMNGYAYFVETPLKEAAGQESAPSTGAQVNQARKDAPKNDHLNGNLQAAASSPGHVAFVAPPSSGVNLNGSPNVSPGISPNAGPNSKSVVSPAHSPVSLNSAPSSNQLNAQQGPVYRPEEESRSNEKVNLDHHAIREQAFDPKHLVHSQLSAIEFKTSPELAKLEESLKRSAEWANPLISVSGHTIGSQSIARICERLQFAD